MFIRGVIIGLKNCVFIPEINLLINLTDAQVLRFKIRSFIEKAF